MKTLHQQAALMIRSLVRQLPGGVCDHIVFEAEGNIVSSTLLEQLEGPQSGAVATVERWEEEYLASMGEHWGDRIAWESAREIARRLDNRGIRVGDTSGDGAGGEAALAIGEHAFRAGWDARDDPGRYNADVDRAWSDYDPPEHIKALA